MNDFKNILDTFQRSVNRHGAVQSWGFTLLLHAMIIGSLWNKMPPRLSKTEFGQERRMEVWLLPNTTPPPLKTIFKPSKAAPTHLKLVHVMPRQSIEVRQSRFRVARSELAAPKSTSLAVTASSPVSSNEEAGTVATHTFDIAAARSDARAIASESFKGLSTSSKSAGTMAPSKSERIQEQFDRARRVNCLKPNESTNLLANVTFLARDLVANAIDDSGCKW